MASAVERREHSSRRSGHTRSRSPARERGSPPRRRSPPARRERSPAERSGSLRRRSPVKASISHRERSPQREKVNERVRSPKQARAQSGSSSPARKRESRSPSPRTKRLRRSQAEREAAEVTEGDRRKPSNREERDSGRHRERDERRDVSRDRKAEREDDRSAFKDRKLDLDDGRDHSRDRRADRDDRSGASRETRSARDAERHDSRGKRSDWDDRKGASREQRADQNDRRNSARERMADWEENNGGSGTSSRRGRSVSPEEHRHRGRHESHTSPRASRSAARVEDARSTGDAASRSGDPDSLVKMNAAAEALEAKEKQKPSFELSGKLAEETNRVAGVNLLYSEPPEARKSDIRWRLYVFKGGEALNEPLYVHRMSSYLFGRERKVADIPTDHPSCSKQHAVLQYRLVEKEQPDGMMSKQASHSHFFIPEIFKDLKKVIVLEDDVVVQRDLSFLWNLDMGDKVNGAVKFCGLRLGQLRNLLGKVTYDPQSCAWMSGVNVINLDKWREYNVTENYLQLFEKFRKNDDEASLRAAALPVSLLSFQHLTYPLDERLTLSGLGYDYAIGEEVARTSASLHYNGNMKPWLELGIPDYRKYWKRFLTRDEQFMDECNVSP